MVTVTNREIYDKICEIEKHVIQTNGKVKLNRWMCTTAITITLAIIAGILL